MIEFLCLPNAAPFCASAEYAPTVHVGSLDYQGGLFERATPADPEIRARLGVDVTFGFPDVGWPVDISEVRKVCNGDRCVRFVVDCTEASATCSWSTVQRWENGSYSKFSFISVQAASEQQMMLAMENLALDLGGGVRVPLASLINATHVSAANP